MKQLNSSKKQKLLKLCKSFLKHKELDDIIVYGSFFKGNPNANDIDICLIFNSFNENLIKKMYALLENEGINPHITKTKFSNLLEEPVFWKTLISEGFSLKKNKLLSESLGMSAFILFQYEIKTLEKKRKQTMLHALYGTGGRKNLLKEFGGQKLGGNSVIIPVEISEKLRAFFESWKVRYKATRIWM